MKKWLTSHGRGLSIGIVLLLMLGLLAYVALRAGPLPFRRSRSAPISRPVPSATHRPSSVDGSVRDGMVAVWIHLKGPKIRFFYTATV